MKIKKFPEGWKEVEFEEVADFLRGPFGSSVKKSVCVKKGPETYKLYAQGNAIHNDFSMGTYYVSKETFQELEKFELLPGDIVVTCAGTLGKIATAPEKIEKGIINSVLMRIRLDASKVLNKYFLYFFQSPGVQNQIFSRSQGATIKNMFPTKKLKAIKIPLPPIQVQKQIVGIFERIEKIKERHNQSSKELDSLMNSLLQMAFNGELTH
jgi:type I restriction enzyme S subunit